MSLVSDCKPCNSSRIESCCPWVPASVCGRESGDLTLGVCGSGDSRVPVRSLRVDACFQGLCLGEVSTALLGTGRLLGSSDVGNRHSGNARSSVPSGSKKTTPFQIAGSLVSQSAPTLAHKKLVRAGNPTIIPWQPTTPQAVFPVLGPLLHGQQVGGSHGSSPVGLSCAEQTHPSLSLSGSAQGHAKECVQHLCLELSLWPHRFASAVSAQTRSGEKHHTVH